MTMLMITSVFAQCTGKVTGGGQIPIESGGKASFGFNAMWFSRERGG